MKKLVLGITATILMSSIILATLPAGPVMTAHAAELELFLGVPKIASQGQTVQIVLWTVFNNDTASGGTSSDLAFNKTGAGTPCVNLFPCLSFSVNTNLGIKVAPHVHTPSGGFVALPAFRTWTHPGAWAANYTVPSDKPGLYGVHVYANYTTGPGVSFVYQTATSFSVEATSLSSVQTWVLGGLGFGLATVVLGIIILAVVLRKRASPKLA